MPDLGAFSLSLAVRDIAKSKAFYEKLGFQQIGGNMDQGWLILQNASTNIGLFQGMFEKNMLTFVPGWDRDGKPVKSFMDIRDIQKHLKKAGIDFAQEVDEAGEGPGNFMIMDPDGNPVLVDQHV
jgi:catechol 2,3-dioxygenase-like lactoylglutathione lyase family enzyme